MFVSFWNTPSLIFYFYQGEKGEKGRRGAEGDTGMPVNKSAYSYSHTLLIRHLALHLSNFSLGCCVIIDLICLCNFVLFWLHVFFRFEDIAKN